MSPFLLSIAFLSALSHLSVLAQSDFIYAL